MAVSAPDFQSVWIYLINLFSRDCSRQHEESVVFQLNRKVLLILTWSFFKAQFIFVPQSELKQRDISRTIYTFLFVLYTQSWCV